MFTTDFINRFMKACEGFINRYAKVIFAELKRELVENPSLNPQDFVRKMGENTPVVLTGFLADPILLMIQDKGMKHPGQTSLAHRRMIIWELRRSATIVAPGFNPGIKKNQTRFGVIFARRMQKSRQNINHRLSIS